MPCLGLPCCWFHFHLCCHIHPLYYLVFHTCSVCSFVYLLWTFAVYFPKCLKLFRRRVSLKRDACILLGGSGFLTALHVCAVDTARWSLPPFWHGVGTHGWPLGSGHPALTCEPPGRLVWVGPTVTPHAVTLDWGCHAWIYFNIHMVLSSMAKGLLQHACLLASSFVGLYRDSECGSALKTNQQIHIGYCYTAWETSFRNSLKPLVQTYKWWVYVQI